MITMDVTNVVMSIEVHIEGGDNAKQPKQETLQSGYLQVVV